MSCRTRLARWAVLWSLAALCGCSALLPKGQTEDLSPFSKYEDARSSFVKVTPYRTTCKT
jgi:hypothetical protein